MPDRIYQRAVELMEAEIGDELVALEPQAGMCFGFNSVATTVWQQLATPRTFSELKGHLLDTYDVEDDECGAELEELLSKLVEQRLITCTSNSN